MVSARTCDERTWVDTDGAAALIGVHPGTLRRWRTQDYGPQCYRVGRDTRYDLEDIDAWIVEQKKATTRGGRGA